MRKPIKVQTAGPLPRGPDSVNSDILKPPPRVTCIEVVFKPLPDKHHPSVTWVYTTKWMPRNWSRESLRLCPEELEPCVRQRIHWGGQREMLWPDTGSDNRKSKETEGRMGVGQGNGQKWTNRAVGHNFYMVSLEILSEHLMLAWTVIENPQKIATSDHLFQVFL